MDNFKARDVLIFGAGVITSMLAYHQLVKRPDQEMTVALIKPDAVADGRANTIFDEISAAEMSIIRRQTVTFSENQAKEYYLHMVKNLDKSQFYEPAWKALSSGPCIVVVLVGVKAINKWRKMIGMPWPADARKYTPNSLRARYGRDEVGSNAVHGAASSEEVVEQLVFFAKEFKNFKDLLNHKL